MEESELVERGYYINKQGVIFDSSLNENLEDNSLKESKKTINKVYNNQDENINDFFKVDEDRR